MGRKSKLSGTTYQAKTGCGTLYITINEDEGKPIEVFATMGKSGGCASSQSETIGRLISLSLKNEIGLDKIIKQMAGISCHAHITVDGDVILSCSDAIAKILTQYLSEKH